MLLNCAIFFVSLSSYAQEGSAQDDQQRLQELQRSIKELQQQLDEVKNSRSEMQKELQQNETEIGEIQQRIEGIKQELQQEQEKLGELTTRRGELIALQREQRRDIKQQVQAAYRLGRQSNLKLLLNQNDPQRVARVMRYHDYMLNSRAEKLSGYMANLEELRDIEPDIRRHTDSLKRKQAQLQQRHDELSDKRSKRQSVLARLDETIKNKDQELEKLTQDSQHLEKLVSAVFDVVGTRAFNSSDAPFSKQQGKLSWPTQGKLAHRYGSDRIQGKLKWKGVVIESKEGDPVRAVHHGRVRVAQYLRGYGLTIFVDHGDGYISIYAHNQSLLKNEGNWVEAGEIIATVGNSGGRRQAGLYFEIRHNVDTLNPSLWCS